MFDSEGRLTETGWARRLLMNYNREQVRAGKLRLKEWDCYCILNPSFGLALIIADVGYFGMATVEWNDFSAREGQSCLAVKPFTRGSMNLPRTADYGDLFFAHKDNWIRFDRNDSTGPRRELSFNFPGFVSGDQRGISGHISLYQDPGQDTMVNVIPFENPRHFVYVQKIVCMPATGTVQLGSVSREFLGTENNSWGALDWSRGVFPYRTKWWWAYASGIVNGKHFGFNIDYGFGTQSNKSMLFYDGRGHHLDKVTYTWDDTDLMKPWRFTSNDGRVSLSLEPVHMHNVNKNMLALSTKGIHVYGYYTGNVTLDDGTILKIDRSDNVFGSAEHFNHRW